MNIEKPSKLYNEQGKVNDPDIARLMAEEEDTRHKRGESQDRIDKMTNFIGEGEQTLKEFEYKIASRLAQVFTVGELYGLEEHFQKIITKAKEINEKKG